jgi:hypothetical protein
MFYYTISIYLPIALKGNLGQRMFLLIGDFNPKSNKLNQNKKGRGNVFYRQLGKWRNQGAIASSVAGYRSSHGIIRAVSFQSLSSTCLNLAPFTLDLGTPRHPAGLCLSWFPLASFSMW